MLDVIKNEVESLQEFNECEVDSISEKVIVRYNQRIKRDLSTILNIYEKGKDESAALVNLKDFLLKNWNFVKGTSLCYTSIPNSDATNIIFKIALYVGDKLQQNPLTLLMPELNLESIDISYPNLGDLEIKDVKSLQSLLTKHILSEDSHALIPIKVLANYESSSKTLINPYYNLFNEGSSDTLTDDEFYRLKNHSNLTLNFVEVQSDYQSKALQNNSLLGELERLCKLLSFYSSNHVGSELDAGIGVYSAIPRFFEFYNTLSIEKKFLIPSALKTSIENLKKQSSDYNNRGGIAASNIQTCIATLRADILSNLKGNEATLSKITLEDADFTSILDKIIEARNLAKEGLLDSVYANKNTEGNDKLGITSKLLSNFDITLEIQDKTDLQLIINLTSTEILKVLNKDNIKQIVAVINTSEHFVNFCIDTPLDKLNAILIKTKDECLKGLNIRKFSEMVILLEEERFFLVFNAFKDIIKSPRDFSVILQHLNTEQKAVVSDGLRGNLHNIIKSSRDFNIIFKHLNNDQKAVVYEDLKGNLHNIIKSSFDFSMVFCYLNDEQRAKVYDVLKCDLHDIIKSSSDFNYVLQYLNADQITAFFESLKGNWCNIIKSSSDFSYVILYLNVEQITAFFESLKGNLYNIIKLSSDFNYVLKHLDVEQRAVVYEFFKGNLNKNIKSSYDFSIVLYYLNNEQRAEVYNSLKGNLYKIIKSSSDFSIVFCNLNNEQRAEVYDVLKDDLHNILKSTDDFINIFHYIECKQAEAVYWSLKSRIKSSLMSEKDYLAIYNEPSCYGFRDNFKEYCGNIELLTFKNNARKIMNDALFLINLAKESVYTFSYYNCVFMMNYSVNKEVEPPKRSGLSPH